MATTAEQKRLQTGVGRVLHIEQNDESPKALYGLFGVLCSVFSRLVLLLHCNPLFMIHKTIGIYTEPGNFSPFNEDELVVEVSEQHIVCFSKSSKSKKVTALEYFKLEQTESWSDIFYELRVNSGLLDKSFGATKLFYNFPQSVLIPSTRFSANAANTYMNLLLGDDFKTVSRYDVISAATSSITNAYRLPEGLAEAASRNFLSLVETHVYSAVISDLFNHKRDVDHYLLKAYFYEQFFIAAVLKDGDIHLLQHFAYATAEDALYHLLNIVEQLHLSRLSTQILLSGNINSQDQLIELLQHNFSHVILEPVRDFEALDDRFTAYAGHYFTPFFNLLA